MRLSETTSVLSTILLAALTANFASAQAPKLPGSAANSQRVQAQVQQRAQAQVQQRAQAQVQQQVAVLAFDLDQPGGRHRLIRNGAYAS